MNRIYIINIGRFLYKQGIGFILLVLCIHWNAAAQPKRDSASFPTSVSAGDRVISAEELKKGSLTNWWDALQLFEPALHDEIKDIYGDIPGYQPSDISVRGKNHWTTDLDNPGRSLWIIDGVRVPLRQAVDIDINDIDQVIVYKDPASLSRFGIYGANGVIELITRKPAAGKIEVSYLFDALLQQADIHTHSVAEEYAGSARPTYWLKQPLATAFQHRHKINIEGGDEYVKYRFSTRFSPSGNGVMKGSGHDMLGLNSYIEYNFKALHISNDIAFNQTKVRASSYGTYDYYHRLNPEQRPTDESGIPYTVLNEKQPEECINPIYEASLNSYDIIKSHEIYDNLNLHLALKRGFSITGSFAFIRETSRQDIFISPLSGLYYNAETGSNTGKYDIARDNTLSFESSLTAQYRKHTGKSDFGVSAGIHTFSGKYYDENYGGIGIPTDRMAYISFAKSYDTLHMAEAHRQYDRTVQSALSGHYVFDRRYGIQAQLNYNRSSLLSPGKRNALFFHTSAYWNIHNESFLENSPIHRLTLYASIGTTGGIGFTDRDYNVTYQSDIGNEYIYNYYLIGSAIQSMPNRDIKWHTVHTRNVSLLLGCAPLSLTLNYYNNLTQNAVVLKALPLSTGYENTVSNGGEIRNSGVEFYLNSPIIENRNNWSLHIFISGAHNRNSIEKIPEYFASQYNKLIQTNYLSYAEQYRRLSELQENRPIHAVYRYEEVHTDETGQTVLGSTPVYAGSTDDKFRGSIGFSLQYKQWQLNTIANGAFGGLAYDGYHPLPVGNHFYASNNSFTLSSLQLGYLFTPEICRKMHLRNLSLTLSGNHLVYAGSSRLAKGILYPYARTMTFSLRVTF